MGPQQYPVKYYGVKFAKVTFLGGTLPPNPPGAPFLGLTRPPAASFLRSSPLAVAPKTLSTGAPITRPPRESFTLPLPRGALRLSATLAGACRGEPRPEAPRVGRGSVNVATFPARWAALAPWAAPVGASQPARGARGLRPPLLRKYVPIVLFLRFFVRFLFELIIFASSSIFGGLKVRKYGTLYFYFGASYFALPTY